MHFFWGGGGPGFIDYVVTFGGFTNIFWQENFEIIGGFMKRGKKIN